MPALDDGQRREQRPETQLQLIERLFQEAGVDGKLRTMDEMAKSHLRYLAERNELPDMAEILQAIAEIQQSNR